MLKIPLFIPEMREEEFFSVKNKKLTENSDLELSQLKGLLQLAYNNIRMAGFS